MCACTIHDFVCEIKQRQSQKKTTVPQTNREYNNQEILTGGSLIDVLLCREHTIKQTEIERKNTECVRVNELLGKRPNCARVNKAVYLHITTPMNSST